MQAGWHLLRKVGLAMLGMYIHLRFKSSYSQAAVQSDLPRLLELQIESSSGHSPVRHGPDAALRSHRCCCGQRRARSPPTCLLLDAAAFEMLLRHATRFSQQQVSPAGAGWRLLSYTTGSTSRLLRWKRGLAFASACAADSSQAVEPPSVPASNIPIPVANATEESSIGPDCRAYLQAGRKWKSR